MQTYTVELGERSYPIHIGDQLLGRRDLLSAHLRGRVLVVCAQPVAGLYLDVLRGGLGERDVESLILPDGETTKTLATVERVFDHLLEHGFDRQSTLVALGGGVIGDITGFAAACYQRGVDFVQVPTTLLAQVDSSVGGKTGVNHRLGKNMIGAFHQPLCVLADTGVLQSLTPRDFRSGLAEVIKYGLIRDAGFFDWLETCIDALLARDGEVLGQAIARSCDNKAQVVAEDERETGARALLNLGHTFGHAIETETGYGEYTHGEAVAIGMAMAARFSVRLGWLEPPQCDRCIALLERAGLPVSPPTMAAERYLQHMARDKKARDGTITLVLLRGIGEAVISRDYPAPELDAFLAA